MSYEHIGIAQGPLKGFVYFLFVDENVTSKFFLSLLPSTPIVCFRDKVLCGETVRRNDITLLGR